MGTLLLRLAAPLQSWGATSRFNKRTTEKEPTKSGVLGMLAAALGKRRDDPLDDLRNLRFGVRVDQPGELVKDFHTAHTSDGKQSFTSERYYLADAVFLVGIEAENSLLKELDRAINNPVFPLFLGRRSCPPTGRLSLGIRSDENLLDALDPANTPWIASDWYQKKARRLKTMVLDTYFDSVSDGRNDRGSVAGNAAALTNAAASSATSSAANAIASAATNTTANAITSTADSHSVGKSAPRENASYSVRDLPVLFDQVYRQYAFREVRRKQFLIPLNEEEPLEAETKHDALSGIGVD